MIDVDGDRLAVVALDARRARDVRVVGAKAAHLARAAGAGLPVLPGFVVAAADEGAGALQDGAPPWGGGAPHGDGELRRAWSRLSDGGTRPLVVRSSAADEDGAESSLAGLFETVLDVHGWDAFTDAVRRVLRSARRVPGRRPADVGDAEGAGDGGAGAARADMAVLVQPMVRAVVGGVMFGADPLAGRYDRVLVSAVPGGPDRLVDGSVDGVRYHLTRRARLVRTEPAEPRGTRLLDHGRLRRLVRLARLAQREFGGPQDIEFGFDADDRLWLFQTRPITAMPTAPPRGARLLGPGPVAETFPGVVQPLEEDLWLAPMSYGLTLALDLTGSAPRGLLRRLPVVTTVDGRAAADLRLLGAARARHPALAFLNPAPGARRAGAAWRTGRLRAALPMLAVDLMADVDRYLSELPPPHAMLSGRLFAAVSWGRTVLASLHAQESLAGALLAQDSGATAVGEALAVLSEVRAGGGALAVLPEVRAAGGARAGLPEVYAAGEVPAGLSEVHPAGEVPADLSEARAAEAASVRCVAGSGVARLTAEPDSARRAAGSDAERCVAAPGAAQRLAAPGAARPTPEPDDARLIARHPVLLSLLPPSLGPRPPLPARTAWAGVPRGTAALPPREGLRLRIRWVQEMQAGMVREIAHRFTAAGLIDDPSRAALLRWTELTAASDGAGLPADLPERLPRPHRPALPATFRLAAGCPVPEPPRRGSKTPGQGAGGGYGCGTSWHGTGTPPRHAVLIVRTLDPSFAPLLPGLTALVAETGSVLSHLAVLAREYRVPTAVGVRDALDRFPEGARISVDGGTGEVAEVRGTAMAEVTGAADVGSVPESTSVPEATGPAESSTAETPHPPLPPDAPTPRPTALGPGTSPGSRSEGGSGAPDGRGLRGGAASVARAAAVTAVADMASGADAMSRPEAPVTEVPPPDAPAPRPAASGPDASPSSADDASAAPPDRTEYRPDCPDYREGMAS